MKLQSKKIHTRKLKPKNRNNKFLLKQHKKSFKTAFKKENKRSRNKNAQPNKNDQSNKKLAQITYYYMPNQYQLSRGER